MARTTPDEKSRSVSDTEPTPIGQKQLASVVTNLFPETTVDLNWGGATTGTLTSVEGLVIGDQIHIPVLAAPPEFVAITSVR